MCIRDRNKKQFFIPKNFAHGFVVLSDSAEFAYKCTDFYHPNDEGGLAYNDPCLLYTSGLSIMADTIMLPKAVYLQKMAGNVSRQTEDSITSISRI